MKDGMTEQESKEFFSRNLTRPCGTVLLTVAELSAIYSAIKARLKSEATCNCWAKEAVDTKFKIVFTEEGKKVITCDKCQAYEITYPAGSGGAGGGRGCTCNKGAV